VGCKYAALGCKAKLTPQSLPGHLKDTDHVGMMMTSHMALQSEVRDMKTKAVQGVETFSAKVVWKVSGVACNISQKATINSKSVSIGGDSPDGAYSMHLSAEFGIDSKPNSIGVYVYSSNERGCQMVPIGLGGTVISMIGVGGKDAIVKSTFVEADQIVNPGSGRGYAAFLPLETVKLNHCENDSITIEVTICIKNRHYVAGNSPASLPVQL
jgi:hypothetical protein